MGTRESGSNMMMPGMPGMQGGGAQGLDAVMGLGGEHTRGDDVRQANVTAAIAIANIVKSSLGPVGLDKMLLDDVGEITITNDGATILGLLEVEHPAGKILVELAGLQDSEVGDGTTSVVIVAAELLKCAEQLVKNNVHPTSIISGYRLACKEAVKYIQVRVEHHCMQIKHRHTQTHTHTHRHTQTPPFL